VGLSQVQVGVLHELLHGVECRRREGWACEAECLVVAHPALTAGWRRFAGYLSDPEPTQGGPGWGRRAEWGFRCLSQERGRAGQGEEGWQRRVGVIVHCVCEVRLDAPHPWVANDVCVYKRLCHVHVSTQKHENACGLSQPMGESQRQLADVICVPCQSAKSNACCGCETCGHTHVLRQKRSQGRQAPERERSTGIKKRTGQRTPTLLPLRLLNRAAYMYACVHMICSARLIVFDIMPGCEEEYWVLLTRLVRHSRQGNGPQGPNSGGSNGLLGDGAALFGGLFSSVNKP
jgi:hypothetical protein